jgi:hypothetical protein
MQQIIDWQPSTPPQSTALLGAVDDGAALRLRAGLSADWRGGRAAE